MYVWVASVKILFKWLALDTVQQAQIKPAANQLEKI